MHKFIEYRAARVDLIWNFIYLFFDWLSEVLKTSDFSTQLRSDSLSQTRISYLEAPAECLHGANGARPSFYTYWHTLKGQFSWNWIPISTHPDVDAYPRWRPLIHMTVPGFHRGKVFCSVEAFCGNGLQVYQVTGRRVRLFCLEMLTLCF